ncbi:3-dehydroquinate synthase [Croceicoccus naphthovorans]|uniref:3-dehydroquinate synthase n=1 Tax=Croceicoccus naphthovorans TaxID=1348774 RepID=UPI000A50A9AE|nr:3-dehydroquinate synthase [Croceicoccus naphthovorans]MBB3990100.1 3-dehydroquinate synthase [Croceicoccus naphthovorans]
MTEPATIPVALSGRSYEVRVGPGLLARLGAECGLLLRKDSVPVVTDANVAALYTDAVEASLAAVGKQARWLVLPAGEKTKDWAHLAQVIDFLLAEGVDRGDHIVALGGGVIGDLTGFAAAVLKRGCGFVQVPTTLLAQVDSSVGGKTAINVPMGKNLVGAFHQPGLVLADTDVLGTLPPRELRAGYAEVVKYGLIDDANFFAWCEAKGPALLAGDAAARIEAVSRSVAAKARVVAEDERETTGTRALLNLGHTFGHALEAETGYSDTLLHGEAVAIGMVLAARYSVRRGLMQQADADRIAAHFEACDMKADVTELGLSCDGRRLADHMLHDKKMDAGTLPFLLMRGIGQTFLAKDVAIDDVAAFLDRELKS